MTKIDQRIFVQFAEFDYSETPIWFQLESVVSGWGEIVPLFKTGTYDTTPGPNPSTFSNFGAGVMFLPSGLAYYEQIPSALIPSYSPLIFSFKLKSQKSRDHDRDGILSKYEVAARAATVTVNEWLADAVDVVAVPGVPAV